MTCVHLLRSTSNVDGTPIKTIADQLPGQPFNGIDEYNHSHDGVAVALDCNSTDLFNTYVIQIPRLAEFIFSAQDIPSYLTLGCEDTEASDARQIIAKRGPVGTKWQYDTNQFDFS